MKSLLELQPLIIEWANERNLLFAENATKQKLKLLEETGELASAILKNDVKLQKDAIGDMFVVLVILNEQVKSELSFNTNDFLLETKDIYEVIKQCAFIISSGELSTEIIILNNVCNLLNLDIIECANLAWNEIKNRKGKTINGTFIKN